VDKHHKPASDNLKQRGRQNFPTTQKIIEFGELDIYLLIVWSWVLFLSTNFETGFESPISKWWVGDDYLFGITKVFERLEGW